MVISSQHHSFDILLAAKYGVEESILIHHFQHWIRINRFKKRNIRDGYCWTYQNRKDIAAHFPYWNYDRVKYLCERLVALGVIQTANYNKNPIDKTLWYSFVDEKAFGVDEENSNNFYEGQKCPSKGKSAQPIPDTKTHIKKEVSKDTSKKAVSDESLLIAKELWKKISEFNPKEIAPKDLASWAKIIDLMIVNDKRTQEEIMAIILYVFSQNQFWAKNTRSAQNLRDNFARLWVEMRAGNTIHTAKKGEMWKIMKTLELKNDPNVPESSKTSLLAIATKEQTSEPSTLENTNSHSSPGLTDKKTS